jgi:ubiquinone/menaquinone biosynthesis C-methylase UbiE
MATRQALVRLYSQLQRVLVPGLRNSQYAYKDALEEVVLPGVRWLDLGCGHQLFPAWMKNGADEQKRLTDLPSLIIGIDADEFSLRQHREIRNRVLGNIEHLPFRDEWFDIVTANVVMEHVQYPETLLHEVHRVLKPGGVFLFHTPNFASYGTLFVSAMPDMVKVKLAEFFQGRHAKDVFPTHYRINTARRITKLAGEGGFRVRDLKLVESSAQTIILGPLVILELLVIRLLRMESLKNFRTNIIAVLEK